MSEIPEDELAELPQEVVDFLTDFEFTDLFKEIKLTSNKNDVRVITCTGLSDEVVNIMELIFSASADEEGTDGSPAEEMESVLDLLKNSPFSLSFTVNSHDQIVACKMDMKMDMTDVIGDAEGGDKYEITFSMNATIDRNPDTSVIAETDCESLQKYVSIQNLPVEICENIRTANIAPPPKLLCLDYAHPEKITQFREFFQERMAGRLDCFQSNAWLLEIVFPGVNKGSSLRFIAEHYNIPIDHTISAGDAENDLPMIIEAGIGCAMKNADEALKAKADYVTEHDNNHAGVAEILYRFCL
jgi:hydroxymethylpyrimidine pyrophosphatase-like HAD family hydrolase